MPNESALRRPDFLPGTPIRLADGRSWTFPAPAPPRSRTSEAEDAPRFGAEYWGTVKAVAEAEDEAERLRAELALAIELLARNYRLTPEAFRELLEWAPDDPALGEMQRAFRGLARDHVRAAFVRAEVPEGPGRQADRAYLPGPRAGKAVRWPSILPGR